MLENRVKPKLVLLSICLISLFAFLYFKYFNKIECPIPQPTFSEEEKQAAKKHLEKKRIPLSNDSFIKSIVAKDEDSVRDMITLGINLNADDHGEMPLVVAIRKSSQEIIELLIDSGANINIAGKSLQYPLLTAIYNRGNEEIIYYMLDHCADVNLKAKLWPPGWLRGSKGEIIEDIDTPLHAEISRKNVQLVKELINRGADVNQKVMSHIPMLTMGVVQNMEIVKLLVENGADVNASTDDGWTPLITALYNDHFEIAKYLIEHGANVNVVTKSGLSPISITKLKAKKAWVIQANNEMRAFLLSKGAKE